jgi:hypothetical protein
MCVDHVQAASATVVRNGRLQQVPAADLVPGDVVELAGEQQPDDAAAAAATVPAAAATPSLAVAAGASSRSGAGGCCGASR